jgi:hypothetical protein
MEKLECQSCLKNQTVLKCENCENPSCKDCSIVIDENEFEILDLLPIKIRGKSFCPNCFSKEAYPIIAEYNEILERAKQVDVYEIEQSQETNRMPRHEKPILVKESDDRDQTLLRLAFLAAQRGFNTIIDVDLKSKKSNQGGTYRKLVWSGSAIPINR